MVGIIARENVIFVAKNTATALKYSKPLQNTPFHSKFKLLDNIKKYIRYLNSVQQMRNGTMHFEIISNVCPGGLPFCKIVAQKK